MVAEATADRPSLRISREPAVGSGPAQPFIPIEVGRDCDVARCSCADAPIRPFERIGFRFLVPGRFAWAGQYRRPDRAGTDLDSSVADNQISRDRQTCE